MVYICAVFWGSAPSGQTAWPNRIPLKEYTQPCCCASVQTLQEWLQETKLRRPVQTPRVSENKKLPGWRNVALIVIKFCFHVPLIACQIKRNPSTFWVEDLHKQMAGQIETQKQTSCSAGTNVAKKMKHENVSASVSVFWNRNATLLIDGVSEVIFSLDQKTENVLTLTWNKLSNLVICKLSLPLRYYTPVTKV